MRNLSEWTLEPNLSPEARLLLGCARTYLNFEKADQLEILLQDDVNWMSLIVLASQHGMLPLLYEVLRTTYPGSVPQVTMFLLHDYFHFNIEQSQNLGNELIEILSMFEAHEIPAIPYKGPVLGNLLYKSSSLRAYGDIDVIVHRRDVARAKGLLGGRGYRLSPRDATDAQKAYIFRHKHSYNLFNDKTDILVDLHWRITNRITPLNLDLEGLWDCLTPIPFAKGTVLFPSPEMLLVLLCVHGAKHFNPWERLIWICDVARLLRVYRQIEWRMVLEYADQLGCTRIVIVGISLAAAMMDIGIPRDVSHLTATDLIAKFLARQTGEWMFAEYGRATQYDERAIPNLMFHVRVRERLRDRISTFSRLTRRKLTLDQTSRKSFEHMPLQAYIHLFLCTFVPSYSGRGQYFQDP